MTKIIATALLVLALAGCATLGKSGTCFTTPGGVKPANCSTSVPIPTVPPKAS